MNVQYVNMVKHTSEGKLLSMLDSTQIFLLYKKVTGYSAISGWSDKLVIRQMKEFVEQQFERYSRNGTLIEGTDGKLYIPER